MLAVKSGRSELERKGGMKKVILALGCILLLAVMSAYGLQAADVSGKWEMTMSTPRGERTSDMEITQDGETITVVISGQRGDAKGKGSVSGADVKWTITRSTPMGELTMDYSGKVDGAAMAGEVQIGDMGSGKWSAKKQ